MIRICLLSLVFAFSAFLLFSQNQGDKDPKLLQIDDRVVYLSDFEYVYNKNNMNPQVIDPKTVDEYLELYINFNLKVHQAIELGLDTHQTFINELAGYRKQLAQPYLTDMQVIDELLNEAYERMQYDIRASHILINLEEHAAPEDTLAAWNKINDIRKRALDGEDFGKLARRFSDDPSAKGMPATANRPALPGNDGDLGFFSVLDMVYPFETAAYNTSVGEISEPVRTRFGYHIIKVTDRLSAMGKARVAHIMVNVPMDADDDADQKAKEKINELYSKLAQDADFADLAQRFSDDKTSGRRGGEMPPFNSNRMVPEFIKTIAQLDSNDISEPVRTRYGWHIIKLFEKQKPSKEEAITDLKNRISRDGRANMGEQSVIQRLKKEYDFEQYPENLDVFYDWVDESIFQSKWEIPELQSLDGILFSFADKNLSQTDFATHLFNTQSVRTPETVRAYVNNMFESFVNKEILSYEESRLEEKYPDFRRIMAEYHDGILLFELTDQKVWTKAMVDTLGLQEFFEQNRDEYMWKDRLELVLYTFGDENHAKNARRVIRKAHKKNTDYSEVLELLNENSQLDVSAEKGVFDTSDREILNLLEWEKGVGSVIEYKGNYVIAQVLDILPEQPKKLNEIRGLVIADYQNYLESKWVEELRNTYDYEVHRDALKKLME